MIFVSHCTTFMTVVLSIVGSTSSSDLGTPTYPSHITLGTSTGTSTTSKHTPANTGT